MRSGRGGGDGEGPMEAHRCGRCGFVDGGRDAPESRGTRGPPPYAGTSRDPGGPPWGGPPGSVGPAPWEERGREPGRRTERQDRRDEPRDERRDARPPPRGACRDERREPRDEGGEAHRRDDDDRDREEPYRGARRSDVWQGPATPGSYGGPEQERGTPPPAGAAGGAPEELQRALRNALDALGRYVSQNLSTMIKDAGRGGAEDDTRRRR
jgi:hypothetical protein